MKKLFLILFGLIIINLFLSFNVNAEGHVYICGKVLDLSRDYLTIGYNGNKCMACFCAKKSFLKHTKKNNSIYEEPSDEKHLAVGKSVTLKLTPIGVDQGNPSHKNCYESKIPQCKEGFCASEIIIEEYK